jgi:predicted RNA-binding Zn ribbon-like protein
VVLDFVNTVSGRPVFTRDDLAGVNDIYDWAIEAGLLHPDDQVKHEATAAALLEAALSLRESIYGVFGPLANGDSPRRDALAFLTCRAAQAMRSSTWERGEAGYQPIWQPGSIEGICDHIADSAVQLLRSPATSRIGACDGCGWLFLDTSRAHARRWCSMNVCGVRSKMRRYHERQTSGAIAS